MRTYELVLVVDSTLSSDKQKQLLTKIEKVITDLKGELLERQDWGKKAFAYPIKAKDQGAYFFWLVLLPPESPGKLEGKFRLEEELLRYLLVKREEKSSKSKKKSREDKGGKNGTAIAE